MTTFILNCVYFILGLFIFIQDICNLSIGRGFKFLCKYITGPADGTVTETIDKSPNHLAVLFTDCSLINYVSFLFQNYFLVIVKTFFSMKKIVLV